MISFCLEGKSIFDLRITLFEFLSFRDEVEESLRNKILDLFHFDIFIVANYI